MRYGMSVPCFGEDPRMFGRLALEIEAAGWDGFFVWDHIRWRTHWPGGVLDPWILLCVAATTTSRIKLGTLVTPPARRRVAKLAKETVTLDRLSDGRLVLGVGLGWPPDVDFGWLGDEEDNRVRAAIFEETMEALVGLWSTEPFSYHGDHIRIEEVQLRPGPLQQPRPPVWVGAKWPNRRPFVRAAQWDGIVPVMDTTKHDRALSPNDVRDLLELIGEQRGSLDGYEVVLGGRSEVGTEGAGRIAAFAEAGVTWWIEAIQPEGDWFADAATRARAGPSR